jgi:hypothetical protein
VKIVFIISAPMFLLSIRPLYWLHYSKKEHPAERVEEAAKADWASTDPVNLNPKKRKSEKRIHHTDTRQRDVAGTPLQINANGQVADDQPLMNETTCPGINQS